MNRLPIRQHKINETEIKNQIKTTLQYKGWFTFPILQGLGCHKGISDMIAIKDGIVLFIEVKTGKGKQSQDQERFQRDIEFKQGHYVLARNIDDVEEYIKNLKEVGNDDKSRKGK